MDETQQKKNSVKIEICDFETGNQNIIDTNENNLLCEYTVKYTPNEDNKDDEMEKIKIKIKTLADANCDKLDDFEVFVYDRKLAWTMESSEKNKNKILQYLMELEKELNTSSNKKENKDFLNALCIMIFYHAVNEYPYLRNTEFVINMREDDFQQYKKIINSFIEENNKNDINKDTKGSKNENFIINLANDETNTKNGKFDNGKENPIITNLANDETNTDNGGFCDFFNNFCSCCDNGPTETNQMVFNNHRANI